MSKIKVPNQHKEFADKLFRLMLELKRTDMYCAVNRVVNMNFFDVFKDSIFSYRKDLVLCERLYRRSVCSTIKKPTYKLSDEGKKIMDEFAEFLKETDSEGINIVNQENIERTEDQIKKYKDIEKRISENPPQIIDKDVLIYKCASDIEYNVEPLKKITNNALKNMCSIMSDFALVYFYTLGFLSKKEFKLDIFVSDIKELDYVDILAVCKIN